MIHREKNAPMSVEELRELVEQEKKRPVIVLGET